VSSGPPPQQGNLASGAPSLSQTGRFVAFSSDATNLVPGDNNGVTDVFVHDTVQNTTERVSVATDGSQADGASRNPSISDDGRFVAFESDATNLFVNDTDGKTDVVVRDRQLGETRVASLDNSGNAITDATVRPVISGNGNVVAFKQLASFNNACCAEIGPIVRDLLNNTTKNMPEQGFYLGQATLSDDGSRIAYGDVVPNPPPSETGSFRAVVANTATAAVIATVDTGGVSVTRYFDLALSGNGATVAYLIVENSVGTMYTFDVANPGAGLHQVQTGLNSAAQVAASDDASVIAVRIIDSGYRYVIVDPVRVMSRSANGTIASSVDGTDLSGDGKFVAFATPDSNMVSGDTNGVSDVFVRSVADSPNGPS
jgi:Tol biopolymer transport system component